MVANRVDEQAIFNVARKIPEAQAQSEYLQQVCGGDTALLARVQSLLRMNEQRPDFLESPPSGVEPIVQIAEIDDLTGTVIGNYKLMEQIGEGGMGVVYMAEQQRPVRRKVALKVIKPGMDTKEVIARFEAERQALAMMDHPNIAKVLDAGTTESGRPFFVMELVGGIPITDYCDRERLGTRQRLELFVNVCQAVQHAHQKGIIHRDIKPSNVLTTERDGAPVPKVIDFGVAKATNQQLTQRTLFTRFQQMVGTPMCMSPEQAALSGVDVDTRTDIYSLGVLLYELLTGTTPFETQRFSEAAYDEIRRMIREEEPPKPSTRISTLGAAAANICGYRQTDARRLQQVMRGEVDWIVMKALQKERARRYDTAQGFANDVQRYLNNEAVHACPPSMTYQARKLVHRHQGPVAAVVALLVLLVAGVAGTATGWIGAVDARRQADHRASEAIIASNAARVAFRLAEEARETAEQTGWELRQQLRISAATRLAAQSQAIREEMPARSLLLAIEAVESTRRHDGTIMPVARETLLSTTHNVGGLPLIGHEDRIRSLATSPDGRWLVTTSLDRTTRLWDLAAEDPATSSLELCGHEHVVRSMAISPSGRWLVTGSSDETARVWDLAARDPSDSPRVLRGHEGIVRSVAITPDSRWLVTGSEDWTARLWDLAASNPTTSSRVLRGHEGTIRSVAITPNGRWLVTGSSDTTARLWDLTAEDLAASSLELHGHEDVISSVVISPDGHWLVTGSSEDYTARIWDLTAVAPAASSRVLQHEDRVLSVAIGPNSRWLATGSGDAAARLWDLTAKDLTESLRVLRGHEGTVWSVAISRDGRWLVTGSSDATAQLWDLTAKDLATSSHVLRGHHWAICSVAISPDTRAVITGSWDNTARLWDLGSGLPASSLVLRSHDGNISSVAISPNERWLVTASFDTTARLWKLSATDQEPVALSQVLRGHEDAVSSVAVSQDSRWLVTGSWDGTARLWNFTDPAASPRVFPGHGGGVLSVAISANSRWLVVGDDGSMARLWDLTKPAAPPHELSGYQANTEQLISPIAMSPDGHWLATADGEAVQEITTLWDLTTNDPASSPVILRGQNEGIASLGFSRDGRWLATGSWDGTARVWDLAAENPAESSIALRGHDKEVIAVAFGHDSRWLVTASWDSTARLWDLAAKDRASLSVRLAAHTASLTSVAFSSDGRWVATASEDKTARVWDLTAENPAASSLVLRGHAAAVTSIVVGADSRWVITASDDKTVRLWDLNTDSLIERGRRLAGRGLTPEDRERYMLDAP